MRTTKPLLSAALVASALLASITGAEANLTLPVDQETGTLSCQIRSNAGRAFAAAPVADCTYASDRSETKERYVALLGAPAVRSDALHAATIAWRVTTRRGIERPGMLAGLFSQPADWLAAPPKTVSLPLMGRMASLSPITQPGHAAPALKTISGLELIATAAVASR